VNSTQAEEASSTTPCLDRRLHPRYRFSAPISVQTGAGVVIPAITLEISEGGLSAALSSPVEVRGTVQLESVTAGKVTAQVRHSVGKIYGFQFLQITEKQIQILRNDCRKLPLYPQNRMGI